MNGGELRAFLDRYVRCLNERSVDELALIVSDELTHNGVRMTRQQWWDGPVGQHLAAVPDQTWTIEDVVIAEDRIAVRYLDSGTPTGWWIGLEPTGARISFREYVFYTVSGGRIADVWSVFDSETVRRQLSRKLPPADTRILTLEEDMVSPYTIDISDQRLASIMAKVRDYDWTQLPDAGGWTAGVGIDDLRRLVTYWTDTYDWHEAARRLNQLPHFTTVIDGCRTATPRSTQPGAQAPRRS